MEKEFKTTGMSSTEIKNYYDSVVPKKYFNNYEHYRWFSKRKNWEEYRMTFNSLNSFLELNDFESTKIFELGPGAGTWTKLFLFNGCDSITLLDQSEYMIEQAKLNLGIRKNINFINEDFLSFETKEKFDFFFSVRAIEYIPDKERVVEKIYNLLKENGSSVIVTKNPINKVGFLKRKQHRNQISPFEFKAILINKGFTNIELKPVVINFPLHLNIYFINNLIHKIVMNKNLSRPLSIITESYLISFKKNGR